MGRVQRSFPDWKIVVSLIRQLTWTHLNALIPLKDPLQREFYAEMCPIERWSVRELRSRIDGMLVVIELKIGELPPRELLERRLHEAVVRARRTVEQHAAK